METKKNLRLNKILFQFASVRCSLTCKGFFDFLGPMKRAHILVVEDHEDSFQLVERVLASVATLTRASSIAEGQRLLSQEVYDLVILDLRLPDGDGFSLIHEVQKKFGQRKLPFLVLSASGQLQDKLTGFDLGAVDYIVKPFEPLELKARVMTRLSERPSAPLLRVGDLEVDVSSYRAYEYEGDKKGELHLTQIEFKLLKLFLEHPRQLFTREQLLDLIWGEEVYVDHRTVDAHISRLRKKIKSQNTQIKSVHGQGYRLDLADGAQPGPSLKDELQPRL